ncbi:MAG: hypothetical protein ACK5UI_10525 [Bacteroidota bacterium]
MLKRYSGHIIFICITLFTNWLLWEVGCGITPDSAAYLSTAQSLATNGNFIQYNNTVFTNWPILYPILLSAYKLIGIELQQWVLVLNSLVLMISLFIITRNNYQTTHTWLMIGICLSYPLIKFMVHALSETVFIALWLMLLFVLNKWITNKQNKHFYLIIILGACLCLQRYAGIFIVLSVGCCLFYYHQQFKKAIVFTGFALLPVVSNLFINLQIPQEYGMMNRLKGENKFWVLSKNITQLFHPTYIFILLLILALIIWCAYHLKSIKNKTSFVKTAYFVMLVYALASITTFSIMPDELLRYYMVLLPVMVYIFIQHQPFTIPPKIIYVVAILFVLSGVAALVDIHKNGPGGYNKTGYKNETLKNYLAANANTFALSNAPDYLYALGSYRSNFVSAQKEILQLQLQQHQGPIIWVKQVRPYLNQSQIWMEELNVFTKKDYGSFMVYEPLR